MKHYFTLFVAAVLLCVSSVSFAKTPMEQLKESVDNKVAAMSVCQGALDRVNLFIEKGDIAGGYQFYFRVLEHLGFTGITLAHVEAMYEQGGRFKKSASHTFPLILHMHTMCIHDAVDPTYNR